jgi:prepilin-type N-terminal cleavage/methylation domain-containing protein
MKRDAGFTLIELLVVMVIMIFALAVTSDMFVGLLNQYKQQSKITETNIEGMVGLELLRGDIERAGYGLPWQTPITYDEAAAFPAKTYNDCSGGAPCDPPRPILSDNDYAAGFNKADLLVIKAANIIRKASAQKWTYVTDLSTAATWTGGQAVGEYPDAKDYVIMLSQGTSDADTRTLVTNGALTPTWVTTFEYKSAFASGASPDPLFVYGLYDSLPPGSTPRMPFNRADYYILGPQNFANTPARCAPNTGVLVKSVISQSDGSRADVLPLLDCAADMKVIFRLDRGGNGTLEATDILTDKSGMRLTAKQIRQQVKEVRVYILAQEGQYDKTYTSPKNIIYVGDSDPTMDNLKGHNFNIGTNVHYRWKLYTIVVQPKNMKQRLS